MDGRALDLGRITIIVIFWCPCRLDAGHDCCSAPSPLAETARPIELGRDGDGPSRPSIPRRVLPVYSVVACVQAVNGCYGSSTPAGTSSPRRRRAPPPAPRWRMNYLLLMRRGSPSRAELPGAARTVWCPGFFSPRSSSAAVA